VTAEVWRKVKERQKRREEDRRKHDRDAIETWSEAEGVDMEGEAERAREKLRNVDRAQR
jgi:hypothetical protein